MNSLFMVLLALFVVQIWFLVLNSVLQIKVRRIAESTHIIVNSQRTMMLRVVAALSRRIADENPDDRKAQEAAEFAEQEAENASVPRRIPI